MTRSDWFELLTMCFFAFVTALYAVARYVGAFILTAVLFLLFYEPLLPIFAKLPVSPMLGIVLLYLLYFAVGGVLYWIFNQVFERLEEFAQDKMSDRQRRLNTKRNK